MQRLTLVALILLGSLGAITGVFFGLMVHFQNAVPVDICRFIPLYTTDVVEGHDVQCKVMTNHTMNCGSWNFALAMYDGPCRKFNNESIIYYNDDRYDLNEYACYNTEYCVWDEGEYVRTRIIPMQVVGIVCGAFTVGALMMTIVGWCGEGRAKIET
ncbi:hypothetical protein BNJ_00405 [Kaumoebavirus]|uniref:hypothetical protein n=1 Tax=Kaumoebavirus TaxID=1859492 RepID=UPI0009C26999|nr:hypothetical protein BNJ_00405 [Kaumoebavirus]ARA72223.1 hypothetical protein BNJ_00405 [Kaumoebavirus]